MRAVQHDWEQFELLAGELAAQLAAALQAPRANAPAAGRAAAPAGDMLAQDAATAASELQQHAAEAEPHLLEQQQQQQQQELWQGSAAAVLGGQGRGGDGAVGRSSAELAGVLSRLMGAPLVTR